MLFGSFTFNPALNWQFSVHLVQVVSHSNSIRNRTKGFCTSVRVLDQNMLYWLFFLSCDNNSKGSLYLYNIIWYIFHLLPFSKCLTFKSIIAASSLSYINPAAARGVKATVEIHKTPAEVCCGSPALINSSSDDMLRSFCVMGQYKSHSLPL